MSEPVSKPKRGRPKTMSADQVLSVAMDAYRKSDPADVSINAICELAGVAKPSVYREFGNEDGLMRATLERYAQTVLSDIFVILGKGEALDATLDALIQYASFDPQMETGCLFFKMRAGKHRLGPRTRQMVEEINAAALDAFAAFLTARRDAGDWDSDRPAQDVARYMLEQMALALAQRAGGEDPKDVRSVMALAYSVIS